MESKLTNPNPTSSISLWPNEHTFPKMNIQIPNVPTKTQQNYSDTKINNPKRIFVFQGIDIGLIFYSSVWELINNKLVNVGIEKIPSGVNGDWELFIR